ncbi:MAG: P-loop NTPase fold protein [Mariprofundales bacterium]
MDNILTWQQDLLRHASIITKHLRYADNPPFITAILADTASGKTSVLHLLQEYVQQHDNDWQVVCFNPAQYEPQETLTSLLAEMARVLPAFTKLLQSLPENAVCHDNLPLLTLLHALHKPINNINKHNVQNLQQQIHAAIAKSAGSQGRVLILIDDLDAYADNPNAPSLLPLLHLFFAHARCQIVITAQETRLMQQLHNNKHGDATLEQYVQMPFHLPRPRAEQLVASFYKSHQQNSDDSDAGLRRYLIRIAEIFTAQPRSLNAIWHQANTILQAVRRERRLIQPLEYAPLRVDMHLALKWSLLFRHAAWHGNPGMYLEQENMAADWQQQQNKEWLSDNNKRQRFVHILGLDESNTIQHRLGLFLWSDLLDHPFGDGHTLDAYARASGFVQTEPRILIEERCLENGNTPLFRHWHLRDAQLDFGLFAGVQFVNCDLSYADFHNADLRGAQFIHCYLRGACFDNAQLNNTHFLNCNGMQSMNTSAEYYELIADDMIKNWQIDTTHNNVENTNSYDALAKIYAVILGRYALEERLSQKVRQRLKQKESNAWNILAAN